MSKMSKENKNQRIFNFIFIPILMGGLAYASFYSFSNISEGVEEIKTPTTSEKVCTINYAEAQVVGITERRFFLKSPDCGDIILNSTIEVTADNYDSVKKALSEEGVQIRIRVNEGQLGKKYVDDWSFVTPKE